MDVKFNGLMKLYNGDISIASWLMRLSLMMLMVNESYIYG